MGATIAQKPECLSAFDSALISRLWVYDLRTNMHFTLKTNPLKRADLDEFVACFSPGNRHERKEGGPESPQEIADDLQTALEQFAAIAAELKRA